jgi:hypothetical protein
VYQPPQKSPQTVGYVQRWTPLSGSSSAPDFDTAAAFMDTNSTSDSSLCADRKLETLATFSGTIAFPSQGLPVKALFGQDPHTTTATITSLGGAIWVFSDCIGQFGGNHWSDGQMQLEVSPGGVCFVDGDSGGVVLNQSGQIVGILTAFLSSNPCIARATWAIDALFQMSADTFYGTDTSSSVQLCN